MSELKYHIKQQKKEVKNARVFAKNFARAMREDLVTSIDQEEAQDSRTLSIDPGERIQQRRVSQNVAYRTCKASKNEQQPILWCGFSRKNQW